MQSSSYTKQVLIFIFILGILALISTAILVSISFKDITEKQTLEYNSHYRSELLESISIAITEAENSRRGYFISNDKDYLETFGESKTVLDSLLTSFKSMTDEKSTQQDNYQQLKSLINERFQLFNDGIKLQETKGNNPKIHKNLIDKGKIAQSSIKALLKKMSEEEYKIMKGKAEGTEQSFLFAKYSIIGGIAVSSLIFIFIFIFLLKKSSKVFEHESQEISREELESIVRERTAEISQINKKLYGKIDELESMEKALKTSEEYYRMLFEQAHDAIIIFEPENETILDVNTRGCEVYGFKREDFIGLSLKTISKNIPQGEIHIKDTIKKGYYHNFQSVHYKKDLTEMLMEINASVINYKGKPAILSINRDITERILKIKI